MIKDRKVKDFLKVKYRYLYIDRLKAIENKMRFSLLFVFCIYLQALDSAIPAHDLVLFEKVLDFYHPRS